MLLSPRSPIMHQINTATFTFLRDIARNNNRDWFANNRASYEAARENVAAFAEELLTRLRATDVLETASGKKSLYRIYRDVRFSKSKEPYKTNFAGHFKRDGKLRRGGYYFHISPTGNGADFFGGSVVGGGFYGIERDDLKRVREELVVNAEELREIVAAPEFVRIFGELQGEKLKTAPRGYDRDHPAIDLLRFKQFYAFRAFTEAEVTSVDFVDLSLEAMLALRPFFDYFSEVLTTDGNGELIV